MLVLEKWVRYFLGVEVTIVHRREIDDQQWVWHVGLDVKASSILNDLYSNAPVDEARMARLLCLFELRFRNPADMRANIAREASVFSDGDGCGRQIEAETAESAAQFSVESGMTRRAARLRCRRMGWRVTPFD